MKTVLICDDAAFMRAIIAEAMTAGGYEVVGEAATGTEAVDRYQELKPDVVTMDMVMPDVSGIEAVRMIIEADPDACIVMCSALGQERLVEDSLTAGATGFVVKPFQASQLLGAVKSALAAA